jgi:GT2 family glycosyltransferase
MQTAPENLVGGTLWSCNFAVKRSAFAAIGGFDERYPLAHMEDVDMRDRILAAGHRIQFVPGASVDHPPRRLPFGTRLARMHRAGVLYMVLHPPVRGLPWYLQNAFRARVSRIVRLPKSLDSLIALISVPLELAAIAWSWRGWMRWACSVAARGQ